MYPWQNFIIGILEFAAWPLVVVWGIFMFKEDIRKLLSRIKTLPLGTELNPLVLENQAERKKDFDTLYKNKKQESNQTPIENNQGGLNND